MPKQEKLASNSRMVSDNDKLFTLPPFYQENPQVEGKSKEIKDGETAKQEKPLGNLTGIFDDEKMLSIPTFYQNNDPIKVEI